MLSEWSLPLIGRRIVVLCEVQAGHDVELLAGVQWASAAWLWGRLTHNWTVCDDVVGLQLHQLLILRGKRQERQVGAALKHKRQGLTPTYPRTIGQNRSFKFCFRDCRCFLRANDSTPHASPATRRTSLEANSPGPHQCTCRGQGCTRIPPAPSVAALRMLRALLSAQRAPKAA